MSSLETRQSSLISDLFEFTAGVNMGAGGIRARA